jgi:hypothetical protein
MASRLHRLTETKRWLLGQELDSVVTPTEVHAKAPRAEEDVQAEPTREQAQAETTYATAVETRAAAGKWLLLVFILLGLLPFDEEVIAFSTPLGDKGEIAGSRQMGLAVIACDSILLIGAWWLTAGSNMCKLEHRRRWLLAISAELVADLVFYFTMDARHGHHERRLIVATLFLPPLLLAIAAAQQIDAPALVRGLLKRDTQCVKQVKLYVLPALPLIIGVGVASTAGALWDKLRPPEVNDDFFAQMAQVLPLLLIVLMFDASALRAQSGDPASKRAITIYTVLMLVVGEALVFSVLASPKLGQKLLPEAHSYVAFTGAWYAAGVAGTHLVMIAASVARRHTG